MAVTLILLMIAAPLLLGYFLKSNGAVVFLSLLGGITLQTIAEKSETIPAPLQDFFSNPASEVLVISAPFLLAFFFTFRNATKKRLWIHLFLVLCASLVFMNVILPEVGSSLTLEAQTTQMWDVIAKNQLYVVIVGLVLSLFAVWHATPQHHESKKHKH